MHYQKDHSVGKLIGIRQTFSLFVSKLQGYFSLAWCKRQNALPRQSFFTSMGYFQSQRGSTLIPSWKRNRMPSYVWGEIANLFPSFNGYIVAVWEWIGNFFPDFIMDTIVFPCLHWSFMFVKWAPGLTKSAWRRHQMETFSALLALCARNSPVTCEFPSRMPVPRSFDIFFDPRLNKRWSKQSRRRWFEKPTLSLCRRCNDKPW